jgi:nucleotide-binding universal stress UspA family protein
MRIVVWIAEGTWEHCVDGARALAPHEAEVTLLYVAARDIEAVAEGSYAGLLGRRPPRRPGPELAALSVEEAEAVLAAAQERLGRSARCIVRHGRVEHEVLEACVGADLLVLARDGPPGEGPRSIGPHSRFILDHARCRVLLVPRDPPLP